MKFKMICAFVMVSATAFWLGFLCGREDHSATIHISDDKDIAFEINEETTDGEHFELKFGRDAETPRPILVMVLRNRQEVYDEDEHGTEMFATDWNRSRAQSCIIGMLTGAIWWGESAGADECLIH
jgi:hypothetical protein